MSLTTSFLIFQRFLGRNTHRIRLNRTHLSSLIHTKSCQRGLGQNRLAVAGIHTNVANFKRRKVGDEKKATRVIEYHKVKGDMVDVWLNITAAELAQVLGKDLNYVKEIFLHQVNSPNTIIDDIKVLQQAIRRSGKRMRVVANPNKKSNEKTIEKDVFPRPPAAKSELKPRPPVVTVMGHVDHGKTTLLDALRHSSVVDQEFGGITQHIGAFSVTLESGAKITFLDTPGHAAFSSMRARGAEATDLVVLVVAADDGVMEQTVESLRMAREANVPILVAINKIDSPKADVKRTLEMLIQVGIQVEELGGDVQAVPISALKKQNLDKLTEALVLQAELLEIGADPTGPVEAVVVESKVHPSRGKLCTLVVQRGTLKKGDILVAGTCMARVRLLRDAEGRQLESVPPGYPAEVEGWKDIPTPGELVLEVGTEKRAREVVKFREDKKSEEKLKEDSKIILEKQTFHRKQYEEQLLHKRKLGRYRLRPEGPRKPEIPKDEDTAPFLNLVLKADVDGTLEAVLETLDTYDSTDCKMDIVHYGIGAISETDIELAATFKAFIYTFNVDCPPKMQELADAKNVTIKRHNVIYKLIDDVKEELNQRIVPREVEDVIGEAQVLQTFEINLGRNKVPVAGCRCVKGTLRKTAKYKLIRGGEVLFDGNLAAMKHLKDDVDVIKTDTECGLQLADKTVTFEMGDKLICYQMKTEARETTWDPGF